MGITQIMRVNNFILFLANLYLVIAFDPNAGCSEDNPLACDDIFGKRTIGQWPALDKLSQEDSYVPMYKKRSFLPMYKNMLSEPFNALGMTYNKAKDWDFALKKFKRSFGSETYRGSDTGPFPSYAIMY